MGELLGVVDEVGTRDTLTWFLTGLGVDVASGFFDGVALDDGSETGCFICT